MQDKDIQMSWVLSLEKDSKEIQEALIGEFQV